MSVSETPGTPLDAATEEETIFVEGIVPACDACTRHIVYGQLGVVRVERQAGTESWTVSRLYCCDCGMPTLAYPTQGWEEAIVSGYLRPEGCFYEKSVEREDYSPPSEGEEAEEDVPLAGLFTADSEELGVGK